MTLLAAPMRPLAQITGCSGTPLHTPVGPNRLSPTLARCLHSHAQLHTHKRTHTHIRTCCGASSPTHPFSETYPGWPTGRQEADAETTRPASSLAAAAFLPVLYHMFQCHAVPQPAIGRARWTLTGDAADTWPRWERTGRSRSTKCLIARELATGISRHV